MEVNLRFMDVSIVFDIQTECYTKYFSLPTQTSNWTMLYAWHTNICFIIRSNNWNAIKQWYLLGYDFNLSGFFFIPSFSKMVQFWKVIDSYDSIVFFSNVSLWNTQLSSFHYKKKTIWLHICCCCNYQNERLELSHDDYHA